jgi:hypothetical protein
VTHNSLPTATAHSRVAWWDNISPFQVLKTQTTFMKKQKFKLQVTMIVDVEIDPDFAVVQEYDSTDELLSDIVSYRFSQVLPVMQHAVKAEFHETEFEILEHSICLV